MARSKRNLRELLRPLSRERSRRPAPGVPEDNPALQAIWHVIAQIPRGRVSTYGGVARAAGLPGRARQTAYALRMSPPQMHLPWHRVVGAGGRIVFPPASRNFREQARRLRAEGVSVRDGRVARAALTELETL
jgi:methylated-DNA-protein-cysteine methyltransferase-like protein